MTDETTLRVVADLAVVMAARAYNIGRRDGYRRNPDISEFPQAAAARAAIITGDLNEMIRLTDEIRTVNDTMAGA